MEKKGFILLKWEHKGRDCTENEINMNRLVGISVAFNEYRI